MLNSRKGRLILTTTATLYVISPVLRVRTICKTFGLGSHGISVHRGTQKEFLADTLTTHSDWLKCSVNTSHHSDLRNLSQWYIMEFA